MRQRNTVAGQATCNGEEDVKVWYFINDTPTDSET
jgi:hypothetical protein